jgi:HEAT repeats
MAIPATTHRVRFVLSGLLAIWAVPLPGCGSGLGGDDSILAPLSPPKPGVVARDAFNLSDPDRRRRAIAMLSSASFGGEEMYVRMYRLLIDDPDATVRAACAKALGTHGGVEDAKLLVRRMEDSSDVVRWQCAKGLQRIHNPVAIAPLTKAMAGDESEDVRMAAAFALGQYAEPGVYNALVAALDDQDYSVVSAARRSLKTLTGYDFGSDGGLWLIWAQRHRGNLFEHRETYVWQPFDKPPTFLDHLQFWKDHSPPQPQQPRGVEPAQGDKPDDAAKGASQPRGVEASVRGS